LQLDKLDRYICLKKSDVIIPDGEEESSSDEDDEDDEDDDDDDEESDDKSNDMGDEEDGGREMDNNEKEGRGARKIEEEREVEVKETQDPKEQPEVCSFFSFIALYRAKNCCRANSGVKQQPSWESQRIPLGLQKTYRVRHFLEKL
jgi:hypothetical protein